MSNLPLLKIGDYYNYSHDKMMKGKWRQDSDMVWVLVGVTGCVPRPTGLSLVTLFSLFVMIKDHPLLWVVVRSQTYYPEHILAYGSGKARYALCHGFQLFPDRLIRGRERWRSKHHTETRSQVWGLGVQVWTWTWTWTP